MSRRRTGLGGGEPQTVVPRLISCESCADRVPDYEIINLGSPERGYRLVCGRCFNTEMAARMGLEDFAHPRFGRSVIVDRAGQPHEFQFRLHLFGVNMSLEAFELVDGSPGGYQFQVVGDVNDDPLSLHVRLLERIHRALAIRHIERGNLGLQIAGTTVRARIERCLGSESDEPELVIDGRTFSWEEFGRMLASFEGWQFRLEIIDRSEEA